jgi:hypothetical protein
VHFVVRVFCFSKLLWQEYRNITGALYGKGLLSMVYCFLCNEFSSSLSGLLFFI